MAKKKKPAGNPARGFATTSIASKPKPEKISAGPPTESIASTPQQTTVAADAAPQRSPQAGHPAQPADQSPEELEAQLERDELQLLVEKHAAKVKREVNRHVSKFQTDRRVLRGQAHPMTVHDWLSRDIMDSIISLAQSESNDSNRRQGQQCLLKTMTEEEAMSRLWILDLTLRDLGFSHDHIQPALKWMCANAAAVDTSAGVWGLHEALEWLALDQCHGHSFSYDEVNIKRPDMGTPNISHSGKLTRYEA